MMTPVSETQRQFGMQMSRGACKASVGFVEQKIDHFRMKHAFGLHLALEGFLV